MPKPGARDMQSEQWEERRKLDVVFERTVPKQHNPLRQKAALGLPALPSVLDMYCRQDFFLAMRHRPGTIYNRFDTQEFAIRAVSR